MFHAKIHTPLFAHAQLLHDNFGEYQIVMLLKDTPLTTFFEQEFLQKWQPICNEFKKLYSHRKVVLKNDRFSSVLLTRRKTQTMQRIGEALQRRQRRGGKVSNYKTTSRWLYNLT